MPVKKSVQSDAHCRVRTARRALIPVAFSLWLAASSAYADLGLQRVISLPGVRGQIGGLALDNAHQHLFVAVTGGNRVLAIDLGQGKIINQITGLNGPGEVTYLPDGRLAINCRNSGTISFYDATTLNLNASVIFGDSAGALRFDPISKKLYFGYARTAQNGIAVVDNDGKPLTQLTVADKPQGLAVDATAGRLYVGFPDLNAITVFDLHDDKPLATWSLGSGDGASYPLELDGDGKRLFIGGRNGDEIAVLDTQTGKQLQAIAAPGDEKVLSFNARDRELYVPGGTGQLAIYREDAEGLLHEVGRILTRHGARNGLFDAESGRYYLAVPANQSGPAEIRVYLVVDRASGVVSKDGN
ncbi:MAG TPA: YncE family protein [Gammaproteobacteria bacterium]